MNKNSKKTMVMILSLLTIVIGSSLVAIKVQSIYIPPIDSTYVVYGYVKTTSGTPIANAKVRLTENNNPEGIYITKYTSSTGYYSISVRTGIVYCTLAVSKSGYYSKTLQVTTKGTQRKDFSLVAIPPPPPTIPHWYLKCATTCQISGGEANAVEVEVQMYDTYAYAWVRARFRYGTGVISINGAYAPLISSSSLLRRPDGSTTSLNVDLDTTGYGYVYYSDDGWDFGSYIVELDYKFKIYKSTTFSIEILTIAGINRNSIIGMQEYDLRGSADASITFDSTTVTLQNYYQSYWNSLTMTRFGSYWVPFGQYLDLTYRASKLILGKFGIGNNPTPIFQFHWI